MKKFVTALLLGVALIFGVVGCHGPESLDLLAESNDHNSVTQTQLTDLQKQIDALKEQLAALVAAGGDNVVVIDNSTISNINAQIADLTEQLAKLQAEFDALKDQVGTDNVTIDNRLTALEGDVAGLTETVKGLQTQIDALAAAVEDLQNNPPAPREEGGPAFVFTGELGGRVPEITEGVLPGDFFIDLCKVNDKHAMWVYVGGDIGWAYFGSIFTPGPPHVHTSSVVRS